MAKAINKGTCQWCNRVQLLPNGVLARHGYNIRFGWQSGTCSGSDHLPYQESCALIEESIEWSRRQAAALRDKAIAVRDSARDGSDKAWIHVYHPELSSRTHGSVYLWEEVVVVKNEHFGAHYVRFGKKTELNRVFAQIKPEGARCYADEISRCADNLYEYAEEQFARITNWAPAPLLPLR